MRGEAVCCQPCSSLPSRNWNACIAPLQAAPGWKLGAATLAAGTAGLAAAAGTALADEAEHGLHAPSYPWPHDGFFRCGRTAGAECGTVVIAAAAAARVGQLPPLQQRFWRQQAELQGSGQARLADEHAANKKMHDDLRCSRASTLPGRAGTQLCAAGSACQQCRADAALAHPAVVV